MAASPSDPAAACERVVARVFGGAVLMHSDRPGPASHDGEGKRFVFLPAPGDPRHYAIDVERRDRLLPAPVVLALGVGSADAALRAWTRLEVQAKLTGIPVLALLRHSVPAAIRICHHNLMEHLITVGYSLPIQQYRKDQNNP